MDVKLHLTKGNPKGKIVEVPEGTLKVGRAEDSDLIIASTRVSRNHCEVVNDGKRLVVRDKGSANGTVVNTKKVQQQVLAPGDELQIGPLTFTVEINGARKGPAAAPQAPAKPPTPARPKAPQPKPQVGGDVAANLERLAGGKPGPKKPGAPAKGPDNVLQISDEDLLDPDK